MDDNSVFASLQQVAGTPYNKAQFNRDIIDIFLLRNARERGIRLPTGSSPDEYKYLGAFVEEPSAGVNENVIYADLASLYPNNIRTLNASLETIIGMEEDLEESSYAEDEVVWGYIDPRPVKHLESGEPWHQYTDGTYKMVYDPNKSSVKWTTESPQYTKFYFKGHDIEEGFLPSTVHDLLQLKEQYRGSPLYGATKRTVNSLYGVLGTAREDSSFRMFDWRIAEAITLTGRKIIQHSRDTILEQLAERGYEDAYACSGDSIPGDEVVVIEDEDGEVTVQNAERVYHRVENGENLKIWSDDGFVDIKRGIEKPNRKTVYRVRTKNGIVHVTEDHSLLLDSGQEVSPDQLSVGDTLLHNDVSDSVNDNGNSKDISTDEAWLLGLFVADGSTGEYRDVNDKVTRGWAISKNDIGLLERAGNIVEDMWDTFGVETYIRDYRDSSGVHKLQVNGFDEGEKEEFVNYFRDMCYSGDQKIVPKSILNSSTEVKEAFMRGYHDGDGYERDGSAYSEIDAMQFRDRLLAQTVKMLVSDMGYDVTIDHRDNHGNEYYRIRTVSFHRGDPHEVTLIDEVEYNGDYVYDFETENHHFHAGIGDIIVHNTDATAVSVPSAATRDEAMRVVGEAVEYLNEEGYGEFGKDEFGVAPQHNYTEIEIESYSPRLFIPSENPPFGERGVKKRYISCETWNDDDGETDDISITGLEATRSDTAPIITEGQELFAETLRMSESNAKEKLYPQLREWAHSIQNGNMALERVSKRGGIGQDLEEYGSETRRASPIYRGAKYASKHIDGVTIQHGDKPARIHISEVHGEYPSVYDTHTAEDGDPVDTVSLPNPSKLPMEFDVDWEAHWKDFKSALTPLLATRFGQKPWDDILHQHSQVGFDEWAVSD